jgi:hypothetical protein
MIKPPKGEIAVKKWILTVLLLAGLIVAGGCTPDPSDPPSVGDGPAVQALVTYLNALVDKDEDTLVRLTCADWEMDALLEYDAFGGVETRLDGLSCQQVETGDGTATVVCQGAIAASYGEEIQEFDLSGRSYQMVEQGGDWLVCGY